MAETPEQPERVAALLARRQEVRRLLLAWYRAQGRSLPWRRSRDPYAILVSEVMLQQTRVETVIPYWQRFVARFPDAESLARADPAELEAFWSGLGYYRRARALQACARELTERYGGSLPADPEALRSLPGVGPYTAGAVASIAFGLPEPALDGNAQRLLARLAALEGEPSRPAFRRTLEALARQLLDPEEPGAWNQAVMDLASTLCLPRSPRCDDCPLATLCAARRLGLERSLPRPRRRPAPRAVPVAMLALLAADASAAGARLLVVRRPPRGLLAGLPGLPLRESPWQEVDLARWLGALLPALPGFEAERLAAAGAEPVARYAHAFSHRLWQVELRALRLRSAPPPGEHGRWLPPEELATVPFPAAFRPAVAALARGARGLSPQAPSPSG
ncbi:MAG: A/G-specific adenine glycosylase [Bacillota bacterium]|nr:A/G-specific adenine glycosylase [Bacillota bacterium]